MEPRLHKILLTASGGPFRGMSREELAAGASGRRPEASELGDGKKDYD